MSNTPKLRFKEFSSKWNNVLLEDFAVRGSGHTPNKKIDSYYNGGIKWISLADSNKLDNGLIVDTDIEISQDGLNNSSAVLHPKGTVLLSRDAGVGKSAVMGRDMAVSQHFIVWRTKEKLNNWFLYYILQILKPEFERIAIGSTIKTIGLPYFKKLAIIIPSKQEQEKIVSFLSSLDIKIEQLRRKEELLKQYKKGIMQKIFSQKIRFKADDGSEFSDWEEKKLGDVFTRIKTKNHENNQNVLTISAQYGLINQKKFFNKSVAAKDVTGYYLLGKGDFAYNKSYSNGYPMGAIKKLNNYDKGVVSTLYICFRINSGYDESFYEKYFDSGFLNRKLHKIAQEGARNHGLLNISVVEFFNDIKIPVPLNQEQTKIANFLSSIDSKIEQVQTQLEATKKFKKGLLQQMFV